MSGRLRVPRGQIIVGDALTELRRLPDASVDSMVFSPPYYRLRDYMVEGQIGAEPTVTGWVDALHKVMDEAHRALVPTGTVWLNVADTYSTSQREGAPRKSLLLGPERLALALVGDGWVLRNALIWQKANPVPSPVKDRLAATYELVYIFAKQPLYFFDLDAIRQPHTSSPKKPRTAPTITRGRQAWRGPNGNDDAGLARLKASGLPGHPLGKNPGSVWAIASTGYHAPGQAEHHATFPLELARRAIRAGTPELRCRRCRLPWRRPVIRSLGGLAVRGDLKPICNCGVDPQPGLVLDPFIGSGTTAVAAEELGRDWCGIELNPNFATLAEDRIKKARDGPSVEKAA